MSIAHVMLLHQNYCAKFYKATESPFPACAWRQIKLGCCSPGAAHQSFLLGPSTIKPVLTDWRALGS